MNKYFTMNTDLPKRSIFITAPCFTMISLLVLFTFLLAGTAQAQCPTNGGGSHSISASLSNSATGNAIPAGAIFPLGSSIRIDALAMTQGGCETTCTY